MKDSAFTESRSSRNNCPIFTYTSDFFWAVYGLWQEHCWNLVRTLLEFDENKHLFVLWVMSTCWLIQPVSDSGGNRDKKRTAAVQFPSFSWSWASWSRIFASCSSNETRWESFSAWDIQSLLCTNMSLIHWIDLPMVKFAMSLCVSESSFVKPAPIKSINWRDKVKGTSCVVTKKNEIAADNSKKKKVRKKERKKQDLQEATNCSRSLRTTGCGPSNRFASCFVCSKPLFVEETQLWQDQKWETWFWELIWKKRRKMLCCFFVCFDTFCGLKVRKFLFQKSFSPTKQKLKLKYHQWSKKKEKRIFLAFVIGRNHALFCQRNILTIFLSFVLVSPLTKGLCSNVMMFLCQSKRRWFFAQ